VHLGMHLIVYAGVYPGMCLGAFLDIMLTRTSEWIFVRTLALFIHSFVSSFVRSFVGSFVRWFVRSLID